ncbi:Mediator of RNA polymerase II transcription subunit 25 [Acorus calamus]|uniref:Mediator of RNA polymerase II transcription subunit 25 n=1 Tax=Acorus calamus TaxID=4465 RepID=A0AAV9FR42_ACOCL|nr:Mediator of RNA polymerase II transcription subunit 25 [Acorus calamus]
MAEKQLIIAVEGTAAMGPYWKTIVSDYLEKIIRCFCGSDMTGQKLAGVSTELALVIFYAQGPYSACLVQRSGWTKGIDLFLQWLAAISFSGGGFSEAAIGEGLAEALNMFSLNSDASKIQQNMEGQKHCVLVAASNPYPLPTPVPLPPQCLEQNEKTDTQTESRLADAETVAKSFSQCAVSLSVISPKQLPKLKMIYNMGKHNSCGTDPVNDIGKNPQFLVLLSENFMEARAALCRPGISNMTPNANLLKLDGSGVPPISGAPTTSVPSGPMMNRQTIPSGNIPTATVKVEPTTVTSMAPGPAFPHIPSLSTGNSQGIANLQNASPPATSQEMSATNEGLQELKPLVGNMPQTQRTAIAAAANVNILNRISQIRPMNSASMTGTNSIGVPSIGGTPMAMHMSNMISNGMGSTTIPAAQTVFSSAQSGITSAPTSRALMATTQVPQNTAVGSFTSATSNMSGNTNMGISAPLATLQGTVGMDQSVPGMGQGSINSGAQIGQSGIGMNQNVMNNLSAPVISSGAGTMMPTPGMSQQVPTGLQSLGVNNVSAVNMPLQQHAGTLQSQAKYVRIWEGALSGQRQGQPVFICKLEALRRMLKMAEDDDLVEGLARV